MFTHSVDFAHITFVWMLKEGAHELRIENVVKKKTAKDHIVYTTNSDREYRVKNTWDFCFKADHLPDRGD